MTEKRVIGFNTHAMLLLNINIITIILQPITRIYTNNGLRFMINLRHIEVFFAVMTSGSVTAAAKQLNVSQPAVTTTLKHAEQRLGFALFTREAGRLIPTEEAKILFEETARAHESLEVVRNLAEKMREGKSGHVRVAATNSISTAVLPDALVAFSLQHKHYSYSISTLNTEDILNQLDERTGNYQLGFTHGAGASSGLKYEELDTTHLFCISPKTWSIKLQKIDFEVLKNRPYVSMFSGTPIGMLCKELFSKQLITPRVIAQVHSHVLAGTMVIKGLGYTILDALTLQILLEQHGQEAFNIHPLPTDLTMPIMVVHSASGSLSDPARYFIRCFEQSLALRLKNLSNCLR